MSLEKETKVIQQATERMPEPYRTILKRLVLPKMLGSAPKDRISVVAKEHGLTEEAIRRQVRVAGFMLFHPSTGVLAATETYGEDFAGAACIGEDIGTFFTQRSGDKTLMHRREVLCGDCPAKDACEAFAEKHNITVGRWGDSKNNAYDRRKRNAQV